MASDVVLSHTTFPLFQPWARARLVIRAEPADNLKRAVTSPKRYHFPVRRLLLLPAAALVLLGSPVLATENTTPPPPTVSDVAIAPAGRTVQEGWKSATTAVDANLVGVKWEGDPAATFTVQARGANGAWSEATPIDGDSDNQADAGSKDATAAAAAGPQRATDPVWVGDGTTAVRVVLTSGAATNVTVAAVDAASAGAPSGSAGALTGWMPNVHGPDRYFFAGALFALAALLAALALGWAPRLRRGGSRRRRSALMLVVIGGLALSACRIPPPPGNGTMMPNIIPRSQWGARPFGTGPVPCPGGPEYAPVSFVVIHHTVNGNNYSASQSAAMVRGIQSYHMDANGYCDIAYHFLIDKYGQIFEGRAGGIDQPVIGGHAGGFNAGSVGVALIGDYTSIRPSTAQWQSLVRLLRWRMSIARINPNDSFIQQVGASPCNCQRWPVGYIVGFASTIVGHGDVDHTSCPGNGVESLLPDLRWQVSIGIVFPPTTTSSTSTSTSTSTSSTSTSSTTTTSTT